MKARVKNNGVPVDPSVVLKRILSDKTFARELWEKNSAKVNNGRAETFEEWYANVDKAAFLTKIRRIDNEVSRGGV